MARAAEITAEFWHEWVELSKVHLTCRRVGNDWGVDFITSILTQLGYPGPLSEIGFKTYEDARKEWPAHSGSVPMLYHKPRELADLSYKQRKHLGVLEHRCN